MHRKSEQIPVSNSMKNTFRQPFGHNTAEKRLNTDEVMYSGNSVLLRFTCCSRCEI